MIDASASFLNGAGISKSREYGNITEVKTFKDGSSDKDNRIYSVPYVSAQALRRYRRNTNKEAGWTPSLMRALKLNVEGHTSKVGGEFNPVEFPEDDLFGFMRTAKLLFLCSSVLISMFCIHMFT